VTDKRGLDRALDAAEALLWVGLLVFGSLVAQAWLQDRPAAPSAPAAAGPVAPADLIEAEDMEILATSREFQTWVQPTEDFATGRWSKDGHLFGFETERGDWIEFGLPGRDPGRYRLEVWLTRAGDYGIVSFGVNGTKAGPSVDLWSSYVAPTGPVDLGFVELTGSGDVLRLTVTGTHSESQPPHFHFGIDGVGLKKE
jgi:hypothetical protein